MALVNRVLMVLIGLALAALGALLVAESVADALGRPLLVDRDLVGSTLSGLTWGAPELLPVWVALIVAGLVLLLLALLRGQPSVLSLPAQGDGRYADLNRRSVTAIINEVAQDDEGVRSAHTSVTRNAAQVQAVARPGADTGAVKQRVEQAVGRRLEALQLADRVRPRVTVSRSRERS